MSFKPDTPDLISVENVRVVAVDGGVKLSVSGSGKKAEIMVELENVQTLINMLRSAAEMAPLLSPPRNVRETEH